MINPEAPLDELEEFWHEPPGKGPWHWLWVIVIIAMSVLICALLVWTFAVRDATAHEAPSGWKYPQNCCAEKDCHPVACESLDERPGGVIAWRGLLFSGNMVKATGDKDCHVCHQWETHGDDKVPTSPRCVFVKPMS